jgi:hypothetical protein
MKSLQSIVYVSSATCEMSTSELESLLVEARTSNRENDITGVLLYNDGNIMQCLEGPEGSIASTYARIRASRRHHDVRELTNELVEERSFEGWDMALARPTRSELLALSTARWKAGAVAPAGATDGRELLGVFWRNAQR